MTKQPLSLIILTGAPGSGKSTWANIVAKDHGMTIVNMDTIRAELCGDANDQSKNAEVYKRAEKLLHSGLSANKSVIWDATTRKIRDRAHLIKIGRAYGARIIGVYFKADLIGCQIRNAGRDRVVPKDILAKLHAEIVPPGISEGFDEVQICHVDNPDYTPVLL